MSRTITAGLLALVLPFHAFADAVVTSLRGDVTADRAPVRVNQRISSRTMVDTGRNSQALLQFDDGSRVHLEQNSTFRTIDFKQRGADAPGDRFIVELLRGAGRFMSGAIGRRTPDAYELRTPQAILGIRGTDFMLAIVNPLYIKVLEGAVAANNGAGTVVFNAGSVGSVANAYVLPVLTSPNGFPPAVVSTFASLEGGAASLAGPAMGAEPAFAGASQLSSGAIVGLAAAAAVVAAAAGGGGGGGTTTTTHH